MEKEPQLAEHHPEEKPNCLMIGGNWGATRGTNPGHTVMGARCGGTAWLATESDMVTSEAEGERRSSWAKETTDAPGKPWSGLIDAGTCGNPWKGG
jgi:hypothetical protein